MTAHVSHSWLLTALMIAVALTGIGTVVLPSTASAQSGEPVTPALPESPTGDAEPAETADDDGEPAEISLAVEAISIPGLEASSAALLLSGQSGGAVNGAVLWSLGTGDAGVGAEGQELMVKVPYVIEVDGTTLLGGHTDSRIAVGVYVYLLSDTDRIVRHVAHGVVLEMDQYREPLLRSGLRFLGAVDLSAGAYSMRVMVRNHRTGRFYLGRTEIDIPMADETVVTMMPPIVRDQKDIWVVARQNGLTPDGGWLSVEGRTTLPTARPLLVGGRDTDIVLAGTGWSAASTLAAQLVDVQGRIVDEPTLELGQDIGRTPGGGVFYSAKLAAVDVPPGEYRLLLTAIDDEQGEGDSRNQEVVVAEEGGGPVWASDRLTADRRVGAESSRTFDPEAKIKRKEIRQAYVQALTLLADGEDVAARRMVASFERDVMARSSARLMTEMKAIERKEAMRLQKKNPYCAAPISLLHRQLYRTYATRGENVLATHAFSIAAELAEVIGREHRIKPPEGFAEGILLGLASDLARTTAHRSAVDLLERALVLSEDDWRALMGLAALHERSGHRDEAIVALRRLVRTHPDLPEGRLRLAVNLARSGSKREAAKLFEGLFDSSTPLWVRTLAFQERVNLMTRREDWDGAEHLLLRAIGIVPDNQRLRIQLAHVLDRKGQPVDASRVVDELEALGGVRGTSPRVRYAAWPALGLREIRRDVVAASEIGKDRMRQVLSK